VIAIKAGSNKNFTNAIAYSVIKQIKLICLPCLTETH